MAIKVCDAIMGSGKSSAAINYMNEHKERKFIYITPYLEEAARIRNSCPELNFKEPSNKLPEFDFRKFKHTVELIKCGENITSTHNMFLSYTDEMINLIKAKHYTLIVDEAVEILRQSSIYKSDIQLLEAAGWIHNNGKYIEVSPTFDYQEGMMSKVVSLSKGNRLVNMVDGDGNPYYYWAFSQEIFEAFDDVIVLTYLFEAQTMKYYFDMNDMPYKTIGIKRDSQGGYHFSDTPEYIPKYTATLSSKIHIFENDKLNSIGSGAYDLSYSWFQKIAKNNPDVKDQLRKNVNNFFLNYNRDKSSQARLWATYKSAEGFVRGKGYYYRDIAFNAKATNNFKDRTVLAYCVNIFMQPNEKNYLMNNGVQVLEDRYALSVMIQWIWRSAIRDGKEIWIYIPSKRMRELLKNWIVETENNYTYKGVEN